MCNILVLESDSIYNIGIAERLKKENRNLSIQSTETISEVIRKSIFSSGDQKEQFDLFIISLNKKEEDIITFIKYVIDHKPELPILIFSYESNDWLKRNGIITKHTKGRYIKKAACWADIAQEVKPFITGGVSADILKLYSDNRNFMNN